MSQSRKRRSNFNEPEDDGSSRYEWGGGLKGEEESRVREKDKEGGGGRGVDEDKGGGADDDHDDDDDDEKKKKKKKQPKMELGTSGLLREEALKDESGTVLQYVEAADSAMPTRKWALIPIKVTLHATTFLFFCFTNIPSLFLSREIRCSRRSLFIGVNGISLARTGRWPIFPLIIHLVLASMPSFNFESAFRVMSTVIS